MRYDGYYYEGEVKKGTSIRHGRGFMIGKYRDSNKEFLAECFWKNDKEHGKCMEIDGPFIYLSDYTEGERYGERVEIIDG